MVVFTHLLILCASALTLLPTPPARIRAPPPVCLDKKKAAAKKPAAAGGFGAAPKKTKPKEAESTPEQRQRLDFMDWVSAAGGAVDAVRLADCGGGLRGLKATRDLKKGEVIVRIPRSIILDVERAEASAVSSIWRGAADEIPGYLKIGLAVLYEQRRGAESDLRPYLELLPSRADFERDGGPAALWSDAELAVTECGGLIESAKRRRRQSYAADVPAPAARSPRRTLDGARLTGRAANCRGALVGSDCGHEPCIRRGQRLGARAGGRHGQPRRPVPAAHRQGS